ncbi:MAG: sigma factor-like helix-turn-helix DNA-binding protein, partial [Planctomycetota bacterium]
GELAERLLHRTLDPPDAPYLTEQVGQLAGRIGGMSGLTLEEELIEIFGSTPYERNRQILIGYYGWEDGRQHTLTEIGARFGITRERIRQVCAKLTRKHKSLSVILAPVMDRTLALIEERLPCSVDKIEQQLARQGLTAIGMSLEGVATGAKLLGRPLSFRIVKINTRRLAVRPDQVDATLAIVDLAKKETYFHGLSTAAGIEQMVSEKLSGCVSPELVTQTLSLIEGFSWLDAESGWFRLLPIAKHGLPKAIDKILAVAGEVTVSQMREAMSRNRRLWKDPPPEGVLLEFCRQTLDVRVEGRRIISDPPRDWKESLTGVEAKLVAVLKEHGPMMERGAMEDLCVEGGMNRFSFHAFVSWSPVIVQLGHSVYGLLGAEVSQREVDELIAARRAKRLAHRVLDSHGRTEDGKVWLSYRLSKAASTYAVITVPAALKKVIHGRFDLLNTEGEKIGTLATKDGRAWGLGAFLRERDARIGDRIVLTLDLTRRTAVVTMGEEAQ